MSTAFPARSLPVQATSASKLTQTLVVMLLIGALVVLVPQLAFAQDGGGGTLSGKADKALEWIKTAVQTILVVSVMGSGVLAAFGRMSWSTVGQVLIGAIVAGMASEVVTALYGGGA
jgi:type IV secretory pathway VirB2 component (pilin)